MSPPPDAPASYPPPRPEPPGPGDGKDPRAARRDSAAAASAGPDGRYLALRDWRLAAVVLAALAGQLLVWQRIDGYRIADTVEYMERAQEVVLGVPRNAATIRSFAFSILLVPYFWVAEVLGLEDLRVVVSAIRTTQLLLGLAAVVVVARTGARLFGARGGLACGALLGLNPTFSQYSVEPLSASAALLFVALGLSGLARVEDRAAATLARGTRTGLWFGASIIMAFQCIPVVGALLLFAPLRRALRRAPHLAGLALGVSLALFFQALLDWSSFGTFGLALRAYLLENAGYLIANLLRDVGLETLAIDVYNAIDVRNAERGYDQAGGVARSMTPRDWYLANLTTQCVVAPAVVCAAAGVVRALRRPSWILWASIATVVVNVALLSIKGSKSFRLWMPLLPMVALVGGAGWAWLFDARGARLALERVALARARLATGLLLLAAVAVLGWQVVLATNLKQFSGYWRAIDIVNAHADPQRGELVVGSAYHWAARFRTARGVRLQKLREHLDRWPVLDEDRRVALLASMRELDWFVGHGQTLFQDPRILQLANELFEVHAIVDDRAVFEDLEPIYVLRRRTGDPRARTFYDVFTDTGEGEAHWLPVYQSRLQHPVSVRFRRPYPDGSVAEVIFLGFDVEFGFAGGEQAWVTYHWYAGPTLGRRFRIVDWYTDRRGGNWFNGHEPGYGAAPTTEWVEGTIVRESYLTKISPVPVLFGGPYLRGDVVPVDLWLAVVEIDDEGQQVGGLNPHLPSTGGPISRRGVNGGFVSEHGYRWSPHALLHVGGFWLPVVPERRLEDDGRPLPEAP